MYQLGIPRNLSSRERRALSDTAWPTLKVVGHRHKTLEQAENATLVVKAHTGVAMEVYPILWAF